ITQLVRDRQTQYEFSKENIDKINRKCHDLKHQLKALEYLSDQERMKQIRETQHAIDFYDAVVHTGNEALDVLLTEKSVYCMNRAIRLSCTVTSSRLQVIELVDLYTLLGNAIDNAIESVDRLDENEKKVISLNVSDLGQMLHIQIENYYAGTLELADGLPVTTKEDRDNHGYGVKSIRSIISKYGGDMQISLEGQVFSLQILIPG
ncbi:MAG: sensor histidine kinase, partial [Clostridia bacterium]|nr:sensor histidine kinase [Clostridia bacterium]